MSFEHYAPRIWLHSPFKGDISFFKTITGQLNTVQIPFTTEKPVQSNIPALLLLNDLPSEKEEESVLSEMLEECRRVIVFFVCNKNLPFFRIWRLLCLGAEDVISIGKMSDIGPYIRQKLNRWRIVDRMMESSYIKESLVGSSRIWQKTVHQVIEVACFSTAPVLLLGESGTGKELVSRLIHQLDKRPDKQDMVLVDCTTIVPELSGSEFFGHEKGAFTNAMASREGAFALADRGTLFLDEIGELPLRLQAELLRVSQEGLYKKVGSNIWKKTQFRLICATNRNLLEEVEKESFRKDLYYRISTSVIKLPSLKERKTDIPDLARYFLAKVLKTDTPPAFDPLVLHYLMACSFPGNIRQLKQMISRMAYRYAGAGPVMLGDIPFSDRQESNYSEEDWQRNGLRESLRKAIMDGIGLKDIKKSISSIAMDIAIEETSGNLQEAARLLEVSDRLVQGHYSTRKN